MSRIGKQPVAIPSNVNVEIKHSTIKVKGPKGELTHICPHGINVAVEDNKVVVNRTSEIKSVRALHGLTRSLLFNMVGGVSEGYKRVLEISGVGFRAQVKGSKIQFNIGYSHPVEFELPSGITAAIDDKQTTITLTGIDKQLIGQAAANIRSIRPPDAYKGKGVRYAGQRIKLKAGKTGKK
ncbi:MAG: 50S ribosomal protein L6 [Dissulfurispiraceae bacterium]|jgi:large subunit ribosomal protein L6|nr:50S ribosomal protein L6 [Dissulfurispiraceae bacterium]